MSESLAEKLECVLKGTVSLDGVLADPINFEGLAGSCFHGLQHFLADEDIRAWDSSYREMQENEMRKLIVLLKSGADSKALAAVTFLGGSGE